MGLTADKSTVVFQTPARGEILSWVYDFASSARYSTDVEGKVLGEFHGDYFTYGAGVIGWIL